VIRPWGCPSHLHLNQRHPDEFFRQPSVPPSATVKLERLPDVLGMQICSLDDPSIYRPVMDVFTANVQPWDHMDPAVHKHTRAVPPFWICCWATCPLSRAMRKSCGRAALSLVGPEGDIGRRICRDAQTWSCDILFMLQGFRAGGGLKSATPFQKLSQTGDQSLSWS
jgi:hypothetical protein